MWSIFLHSLCKSSKRHIGKLLLVVHYLKGCCNRCILLRSDSPLLLTAYYDSHQASCPVAQRYITGYFVSLGGSPISWKTEKQHIVSCSSIEAEYCSMTMILCGLKQLSRLLHDLHIKATPPIILYCDNQVTVYIAADPVFQELIKHIEIDCHFIRDAFQAGFISPSYLCSKLQPADLLTKALHPTQFHSLVYKLGTYDLPAPT